MNFPGHLSFHRFRPAAWLRVSGTDAASFLQGQFTNELRGMEPGRSAYGLWLDQKGKIVADSFVTAAHAAGEFWVASYFSLAETIRRRLEAYIVADDVTIADETEAWAGACVCGEGAGSWLAGISGRPGVVFRGRRGGEAWEWVFPKKTDACAAADAALAGGRRRESRDMERERILAGIPAVPADAGPGDLPDEAGLTEAAISFTKGCYLGQEVIARLKSRGRVRRKLIRVRGKGPAPGAHAGLWQGGRARGELRSCAASEEAFVGLAMVSLAGWNPGQPFALGSAAGPPVEAMPDPGTG